MLIPVAFLTPCVLSPVHTFSQSHTPSLAQEPSLPHTYNPTNREATNSQPRWLYRSPNNSGRDTENESGSVKEGEKGINALTVSGFGILFSAYHQWSGPVIKHFFICFSTTDHDVWFILFTCHLQQSWYTALVNFTQWKHITQNSLHYRTMEED